MHAGILREAPPPPEAPPGKHTPPGSTPPPTGSRLRHTVNERPLRILLECILVFFSVLVNPPLFIYLISYFLRSCKPMACVTLDDIRLLNQVMQYRSLVYWRDLNKIAQVQIHN